ncbi:DUF302 domain-containing protein [Mucilaginibacter lutimaris]|uniref:DUF302 domain-containing protein n=1 Tax=Mucilaginibacter lutimaris TaxID=931629 RepID=A0ABW2ZEG1_9SPHI
MESIISVKHITKTAETSYGKFTEKMLSLLGRIGEDDFKQMKLNPHGAKDHMAALGGFEDLILFGTQEHGTLLRLAGQQRNAIQVILGNPLIALQMTQHDIRAALYAPLRLLVYETAPDTLNIEYDLPSTLFSQFGHPDVTATGLLLDTKLDKLINECLS